VPWDLRVSREHCDLQLNGNNLQISCLESALNPCYFNGEISKSFSIPAGGEFRIGATTFRLESSETRIIKPTAAPQEFSYRHEDAKGFDYQRAEQRLDVLWNLPKIISIARTDEEFAQHLVGLLLDGIPRAEAAAVVQDKVGKEKASDPSDKPIMMRLDSRNQDSTRLRPSRRLIQTAIERGETILHLWSDANAGDSKYTVSGNLDWAFCTPLIDSSSQGWSLYVSGRLWPEANGADDLQGEIRFAQFIAQVVGAIRRVRQLEAQQASYRQFFSPKVIEQFGEEGDINERLKPHETQVTALFCDMRGFSKQAESLQHDLHELLQRCSDALGVMTEAILAENGAIADFQGDAALGFWGWPVQEGPLPACRAALAMHASFVEARKTPDNPLSDFMVGIGVAHGTAIAGKIGTEAQAKVGVFGPVVNLASRLEGMTKILRVPILVDQATADAAREYEGELGFRCRCMGIFRPYGMGTAVQINHLMPCEGEGQILTNEQVDLYEAAVGVFTHGEWDRARELLLKMPEWDGGRKFMLNYIDEIGKPPLNWDGVIEMRGK